MTGRGRELDIPVGRGRGKGGGHCVNRGKTGVIYHTIKKKHKGRRWKYITWNECKRNMILLGPKHVI